MPLPATNHSGTMKHVTPRHRVVQSSPGHVGALRVRRWAMSGSVSNLPAPAEQAVPWTKLVCLHW